MGVENGNFEQFSRHNLEGGFQILKIGVTSFMDDLLTEIALTLE